MKRTALITTLVAAAAISVQCSAPRAGPSIVTTPTTSAAVGTSVPTTVPPPSTAAAPTTGPGAAGVYPVAAADLGATWRPGCPVGPERLRRVDLDYIGFDRRVHRGELVVEQDLVADVIDVFAELYRLGFPIERMQTPDSYPRAEDELSMRDNNTSAFNCRALPSGRWSLHARGRAIDVNPLLNPYVGSGGELQPATAGPYLDRTRTDPGMLHAGDPFVQAFVSRGWRWGGDWPTPKDYQHFEKR